MICEKCGKYNTEEAKFCRFCGELLTTRDTLEEHHLIGSKLTNRTKLCIVVFFVLAVIIAYNYCFSSNGYIRKGDEFFAQKAYQDAISAYTKATEIDSQNAKAYTRLALAKKLNMTSDDKVLEDCEKAIELDSQYWIAYCERAKIRQSNNEYDQAIDDYNQALKIQPQSARAYWGRADVYKTQQQYENAIADYTKAIECVEDKNYGEKIANEEWSPFPKSEDFRKGIPFYIDRGECYAMLGDREHAIADAMRGNNGRSLHHYGRLWDEKQEKKDYSEAIFYYTKALDAGYVTGNRYVERGDAFRMQADYSSAEADYTKAIEFEDTSKFEKSTAFFGLGCIYQDQQDFERAIENYTKTIELNRNAYAPFNNRGMCFEQQGNYTEAIDDYSEAIKLSKDARCYRNRGNVHSKLGNTEEAKKDFAKARIADYTKAINLNPEDAMSYRNRGMVHLELGNKAQAEKDFAKAQELEEQ